MPRPITQSVADLQTSNILQEIEGGIDEYQWQTRGFVQNTATDANTGKDLTDGKAIDLP